MGSVIHSEEEGAPLPHEKLLKKKKMLSTTKDRGKVMPASLLCLGGGGEGVFFKSLQRHKKRKARSNILLSAGEKKGERGLAFCPEGHQADKMSEGKKEEGVNIDFEQREERGRSDLCCKGGGEKKGRARCFRGCAFFQPQ